MLKVKYGGKLIGIPVDDLGSTGVLREVLLEKTGVLCRRQKLLCRGKVVTSADVPLAEAGLGPGSTLMLLDSGGQASMASAAHLTQVGTELHG